MKRGTAIVLFGLFLMGTIGYSQLKDTVSTLPELGERAPCVPVHIMPWLEKDSSTGGCEVIVQGVSFWLSIVKGHVSVLSTRDTAFFSPEGVRPGHTIADVRAAGGDELTLVPNQGYSAQLPSGWRASFRGRWEYLNDRIDSQHLVVSEDSVVYRLYLIKE